MENTKSLQVKEKRDNAQSRAKVQKFGGFITGMVLPNIGAFIAWGLITACFIPTGWIPNKDLAKLVSPTLTYLLPLLIAYTGGRAVWGVRGGVIGTIAAMGCIIGASIPMFLGAMVLGPLAALILKKFDSLIEGKIPAGFEMIVNNFSLGILGMILAIAAYWGIGPAIYQVNMVLKTGIEFMVSHHLLILLSIVNEPAKVLFLNNAIEQGIYAPLGMQQAATLGKSIYFMLESSPGPGFGLLLAYWRFGTGASKEAAPSAMIIHLLGGIHEIYFPYVLMKPIMIIGMILGGMSGVFTFQLLGAGLVAFPSPGSIFSFLIMTPKGGLLATLAGLVVGTVVSFLVSSLLLKLDRKPVAETEFESSKDRMQQLKANGRVEMNSDLNQSTKAKDIKVIVFACDAGMGSSAMGASLLRKKLQNANIKDVKVTNTSVEEIVNANADLIVCHKDLADRAKLAAHGVEIVAITNFLGAPEYDAIVERLSKAKDSN